MHFYDGIVYNCFIFVDLENEDDMLQKAIAMSMENTWWYIAIETISTMYLLRYCQLACFCNISSVNNTHWMVYDGNLLCFVLWRDMAIWSSRGERLNYIWVRSVMNEIKQ